MYFFVSRNSDVEKRLCSSLSKARVWVDSQAAQCGGLPHKRDSV